LKALGVVRNRQGARWGASGVVMTVRLGTDANNVWERQQLTMKTYLAIVLFLLFPNYFPE
jgi:hypothetical protein